MTDPGLPPRPRSLNLLESLVKEEEEKDLQQGQGHHTVVIPTDARDSVSPEFYDVDRQRLSRENSASSSFTEFRMKDSEKSQVKKGNPNAGFKGKKLKKTRTNSGERNGFASDKVSRPFSADYSQNKRNKLDTVNTRNGRPKTSKGGRSNNRTSSPKGQRPKSPHSYSSDTYSSDEEYIKKEKYRSASNSPVERKAEHDSFFDSDKDIKDDQNGDRQDSKISNGRHSSSGSRSTSSYSSDSDREPDRKEKKELRTGSMKVHQRSRNSNRRSRSGSRSRSRSRSSSTSSFSSNDEQFKEYAKKRLSRPIEKSVSKVVYTDKDGRQRTINDTESSDNRHVVVDDYSSASEEEESKKEEVPESRPPKPKKKKPLLSRKKQRRYKVVQIDPDLYLEGKLQQKYSELEELMACSFVDQKSHITRHHVYQMELLRDQYRNASHGLPASRVLIPQSLPGDIRNRRPLSAKYVDRRAESEQGSTYDNAYGTLRSVMAAESARRRGQIRTDILADRPSGGKRSKKKKINAHLRSKRSDTEEENSERPSFSSKTTDSKASSSPRSGLGHNVDDHIKYSNNEKLKKWLKEKDKIYRQHVKEERRKKREEREKLVNEANEKFEKRLESQKVVKKWMKEKNKEWVKIQKEKKQKEKEEDEWLENYKKKKSIPGDALQIRPQSAPARRSEDLEDDQEYQKHEIRRNRESEDEKKQAKVAQEGPHPPQTKFIYKRPVAGKIKLKMQVRGKSPIGPKSDTETDGEKAETVEEKSKRMRMSYDEWVKKKRTDDAIKKKNAERQKELAKSDPELERLIPELGKKRIENKLNARKRIDTGIKKFDDKINKEFGGGDFDGESTEKTQRPRSAYRLATDRSDSGEPALTVKQIERPSTAPAGRGKVPSPKKSVNSPRKAIIPQKPDNIMADEDTTNPYILPFPPEKGIPLHVAEKQRQIFAEQVTHNLNEIEQRALLKAELMKEGVSEEDIAEVESRPLEEFDIIRKKIKEREHSEMESKRPDIEEIMYSPKKREESSDSPSDESLQEEIQEAQAADDADIPETEQNIENKPESSMETADENNKTESQQAEPGENGHSHYKTYENLNELDLDSKRTHEKAEDHLKEDIEELKKRVENLHLHRDLAHGDSEAQVSEEKRSDEGDIVKIKVITESESDPNLVGILKESKRNDSFPEPEASEDEPVKRQSEDQGDSPAPGSPGEDLGNSRKRVSFNEQTEVFQSFETSSTDTVTPEPEDFDPNAESLDAQEFEMEKDDNYEGFNDDEDDRPDILKLQGEKMTINIGGFELNPTVIKNEDFDVDSEKKATFITNPEEEEQQDSSSD